MTIIISSKKAEDPKPGMAGRKLLLSWLWDVDCGHSMCFQCTGRTNLFQTKSAVMFRGVCVHWSEKFKSD